MLEALASVDVCWNLSCLMDNAHPSIALKAFPQDFDHSFFRLASIPSHGNLVPKNSGTTFIFCLKGEEESIWCES